MKKLLLALLLVAPSPAEKLHVRVRVVNVTHKEWVDDHGKVQNDLLVNCAFAGKGDEPVKLLNDELRLRLSPELVGRLHAGDELRLLVEEPLR